VFSIINTEYIPIPVGKKTETTTAAPKSKGSDSSYSSEHIDEDIKDERMSRY
jgi:hypothetical protein